MIVISSGTLETDDNLLHCGLQGDDGVNVEEWMCESSNTFSCKKLASGGYRNQTKEKAAISDWNIVGYPVDYCMFSYRSTEDSCSIVYSFRIMLGK